MNQPLIPMTLEHQELTGKILKAFYHVYNTLGYGYLESVYQKALLITLRKMGLKAEERVPIKVYFEGVIVGEFFADIVVEDAVILELKTAEAICEAHGAQLLNYLQATGITVGLVLNFGPQPETLRRVHTKRRARSRPPLDRGAPENPR
jgi:GxxExxY protein